MQRQYSDTTCMILFPRKAEIKNTISVIEQVAFNFLDTEKDFSLNVWVITSEK
jgi:hypothetical protein